MKRRRLHKALIITGVVLAALLVVTAALFFNELKTLSTLKQVDEHPLYTMTYAGDYGFDDFLKTGAHSDADIERFVVKRLLKGVDIDLHITAGGCTAFTAATPERSRFFARNFDFDFAPGMLLKTQPKNGYASLSMVNLAFAGYDKDNLPRGFSSFLTLAAPYLPFDGINEKGVSICLLAVPYATPPDQAGKITLNTTTAIRLVLDKAANVDEAVALLKQYDYYFSGGVECHYLIADRTGKSALVEFLDHDVKVTQPAEHYQAASNFIAYNGMNVGEGGSEFTRYDTVVDTLKDKAGTLGEKDAMSLLAKVAIPDRCQWSVVYNLNDLSATVCMGENYQNIYHYTLK